MTKAERRVIRAAMRFYRHYEGFYYENGRKGESGYELIRAVAALRQRKSK